MAGELKVSKANPNTLGGPNYNPQKTISTKQVQASAPVQTTAPASSIQRTAPSTIMGPAPISPTQQILPPFDPSVRLQFNPDNASIDFYAPDYVINSPEFAELYKPELDKLVGRDINDNSVKAIMDSGFVKNLQDFSDKVARPRYEAVKDYQSQYKDATEEEAMIYLRNAAAAARSDNDKNTQLLVGVLDDGEDITQSVADLVQNYKNMNDSSKADYITKIKNQISKPHNERTRAAAVGLLGFLEGKKLTQASLETKINEGLKSFLAGEGALGIAGAAFNEATRLNFTNPGESLSETYRRLDKDSNLNVLQGVDQAEQIGKVAGTITGIGADLITTQGRGIPALLGKVSAIPKIGGVATKIDDGLNALSQIKGGSIIANVIRESPKDVAFGVSHAVATNEPDNVGQSIMTDIALNAGFFGGASAIGKIVRDIDTASNGSLYKASSVIASKGFKVGKVVTDIPGVGNVMKRLTTSILDENAPLRRQYRENIANAKGTKEVVQAVKEYKEANNVIRQFSQKGAPEARAFRHNSEAFHQLFETNRAIRGGVRQNITPGQKAESQQILTSANDYIDAHTTLARIEAGQYGKVKPAKIEELKAKVEANYSEDNELYRQQLAAFTDEVTELGVQNNILDGDIIDAMKSDEKFAADYIHLQRDINARDTGYTKTAGNRNLKNEKPIRKLKGVSDEDLLDPFVIAQERLEATTRIIAQNRLALLARNGVESGFISGRVITAPATVKAKNELEFEASTEKSIVNDAIAASLDDISTDLNRLVDDVEDFANEGQIFVERSVEDAIDQLIDDISVDEKLTNQMTSLMDEVGGGKEGSELAAAAGLLYRQRDIVKSRIKEDLTKSPLGAEERKLVVDLFESKIIDRFETNLGNQGMTLRSGQKAVNARSKEIKRLNAEIAPSIDTRKSNVVPFYENGQKGYMELDDPALADYFNARKTLTEDGVIARLLTFSSRVFRAGTTGLDPVFVLFVNPIRDIPQAAIAGGTQILAPENLHRVIMQTQKVPTETADEILELVNQARVNNFKGTSFVDVARGGTGENTLKNYKGELLMNKMDARRYRELERESNFRTKKGIAVNLANPRQALRNIEEGMSSVEYATRSLVFNTRFTAALKRGETVEDAVSDATFYASEATANFYNTGSHTRQLVRTIPYLNAALQGSSSFARLWAIDPVGVTMRMAGGVAMPAMVLATQNLIDEDKTNAYYQIPEYTRRTNFIIMLDGDNWIELPMSFEVARVFNPIRDYIETTKGVDEESFQKILVKGLLGASPIDLAGFAEENLEGDVDVIRAAAQTASGLLPQAVRPAFEVASGTNLYTGQPLNPSDAELYARGVVAPGEEITAGDRTYASRDSALLRGIADATGIDQGILQNTLSSYTGTVGGYLLNAIDKGLGADEDAQGGRGIGENIVRRFSGNTEDDSQKTRDYYAGMESIDKRKDLLKTRLQVIDKDAAYADDPDRVAQERQKIIDDFGKYVGDFARNYNTRHGRSGGFDAYQVDRLVDSLNLADEAGAFEEGSYQQGLQDEVATEARNDANRRALANGIEGTSNRDMFGRLFSNDGETKVDYNNTSLYNDEARSRIYGAPKQIAFEFKEITKADRDAGVDSLYNVKKRYDDRISGLYDSLDSVATTDKTRKNAIFEEIASVEKEYMKEFDKRIKPLVEKYGVEVLEKSRVFDELTSYIMVPNSMTPFASKAKQPYLKEDAKAYLLDRYGIGKLNQSNKLNDFEAQAVMEAVNKDLESGSIESASFKLQGLEQDINNGRTFVNEDTMAEIEDMIYNLNSYKKRRK